MSSVPEGKQPNSPKAPAVAAIVLNYRSWQETVVCIQDLLAQDYGALHCIVVDNASPDDSLAQLRSSFVLESRVTVLLAPSNRGYATGNNFGVRWAVAHLQPAYFFIVNPDVRMPNPLSVERLVEFAEAQPDAGAVSPKVVLPNGFVQGPYRRPSIALSCIQYVIPPIWLMLRYRHQRVFRKLTSPRRCFRTIGACLLIRASAFVHAQMFDEGTFLENEEPIIAERLAALGQFFYHVPAVTVLHNHTRPGNDAYTLASLKFYHRQYRGASRYSLAVLELCSRMYETIYGPLKRKLNLT